MNKLITITMFGQPYNVPCYGSCSCDESQWDGSDVPPSKRDYAKAGVPLRYLDAECDLMGYQGNVASGRSLYVHGPNGTLKTVFACCMTKALVNMGYSVRFENSRALMTEIQGMFGGNRTDALERCFACRVLVLDDLGKEQPTANAVSMLYELIEQRYSAMKPIVVTTNFDRAMLAERLSAGDPSTADAIVSRLSESCDTLFLGGPDRRQS